MKIVTEINIDSDLEKFIISLIKIKENIFLENKLAYPNVDRLTRMKDQYNDTLERMKFKN